MKKYYKLTDQKMQTHNGFQWKIGVWKKAEGKKTNYLCSSGWLHCYESPLLAILHNPIHANIKNPRLFEVKIKGDMSKDNKMKCGFREMCLIKEVEIPIITKIQRIAYGILCAKTVYRVSKFVKWADRWLFNKNRTAEAANAAAYAAVYAAADIEDSDAVHSADAAAYAANAVYALDAAEFSANAAANAAEFLAVEEAKNIDLISIAEEAMKIK